MEPIIVYTDGGCSGNPGPGGWAFVLRSGTTAMTSSGGENATTNNRMELRAVIEALRETERLAGTGASLQLFTDSQYVKKGITEWIGNWKRNGWRTADKKPVKNRELWEELDIQAARLHPVFRWVEGHAGVADNELCDQLVQAEIRKLR